MARASEQPRERGHVTERDCTDCGARNVDPTEPCQAARSNILGDGSTLAEQGYGMVLHALRVGREATDG